MQSLSINASKGLFPSPGTKVLIFSTFLVISGSCNRVSVTPEVLSFNFRPSIITIVIKVNDQLFGVIIMSLSSFRKSNFRYRIS